MTSFIYLFSHGGFHFFWSGEGVGAAGVPAAGVSGEEGGVFASEGVQGGGAAGGVCGATPADRG